MPMQPDQKAINQWRAAAPLWEKHREIIGMVPFDTSMAVVLYSTPCSRRTESFSAAMG
jgi:hypothetical protein